MGWVGVVKTTIFFQRLARRHIEGGSEGRITGWYVQTMGPYDDTMAIRLYPYL